MPLSVSPIVVLGVRVREEVSCCVAEAVVVPVALELPGVGVRSSECVARPENVLDRVPSSEKEAEVVDVLRCFDLVCVAVGGGVRDLVSVTVRVAVTVDVVEAVSVPSPVALRVPLPDKVRFRVLVGGGVTVTVEVGSTVRLCEREGVLTVAVTLPE